MGLSISLPRCPTCREEISTLMLQAGNAVLVGIQLGFPLTNFGCSRYSMDYVRSWNERDLYTSMCNFGGLSRYLFASYNHAQNQQLQAGMPIAIGVGTNQIPAALLRPTARAILICKVLVPRAHLRHHRARACAPNMDMNIMTTFPGQCCPHLFVHPSDA
jgi:hypothetical protein